MRSASLCGVDLAGVAITRVDLRGMEMRRAAKQVPAAKLARRILAIAMMLDGFSRDTALQACA